MGAKGRCGIVATTGMTCLSKRIFSFLSMVPIVFWVGCGAKRTQVKKEKPSLLLEERAPKKQKEAFSERVNGPASILNESQKLQRQRALEAMDRGDYLAAKKVLFDLNRQRPGNISLESLHDTAANALEQERLRASSLLGNIEWNALPSPYLKGSVKNKTIDLQQGEMPSLSKRSQRKNNVVNDEEWLIEHDLSLPVFDVPTPFEPSRDNLPSHIPENLGGRVLVNAIDLGEYHVAIYGDNYSRAHFMAVMKNTGTVLAAYNFDEWAIGPKDKQSESTYVGRSVQWAEISQGTLFISIGHRTYAASSGGLNAYVHAIDLKSGEHLWQSDPLVSNAANFLFKDGWIVAGYGFTNEPDYLYLIDSKNGKTKKTIKLKSGPSFIIEKEGTVFVRTYNTDYKFDW